MARCVNIIFDKNALFVKKIFISIRSSKIIIFTKIFDKMFLLKFIEFGWVKILLIHGF